MPEHSSGRRQQGRPGRGHVPECSLTGSAWMTRRDWAFYPALTSPLDKISPPASGNHRWESHRGSGRPNCPGWTSRGPLRDPHPQTQSLRSLHDAMQMKCRGWGGPRGAPRECWPLLSVLSPPPQGQGPSGQLASVAFPPLSPNQVHGDGCRYRGICGWAWRRQELSWSGRRRWARGHRVTDTHY